MIQSTASERRPPVPQDEFLDIEPQPPAWVRDVLGSNPSTIDAGPHIRALTSGSVAMLTATIALASEMPADTLRLEVAVAYRRLEESLASIGRHAIRFWNFIPGIDRAMEAGLDRYMVFNAGRHDAFAPCRKGSDEPLDRPLATASAVGVGGTDLAVHCLAAAAPGVPIENPRQIPAWRYSARYGPMPPCFSRATIAMLSDRTVLLIGGTASVVGEQSRHQGDVEAQFDETLRNMGALIATSLKHPDDQRRALGRLTALRVYVADERTACFVRQELPGRCPNARPVEIVRARVCRPELALEIEGVAAL